MTLVRERELAEGRRARHRSLPWRGRLTGHPVELAFVALAAAWFFYVLRITKDLYFWADDLRLIDQGGTLKGLFEPYNGHCSVVILAVYRALAELFGLTFRPYMIVGALCLVAVPLSYFFTTRRAFGPALAAVLAMPLLWASQMSVRPAELNHLLVLLGAIFCAAALDRGRRADGVLAAALLFSLASAGGGIVVAAACLVHNALTRAPLRRWLAVLVPAALWFMWWRFVADGETVQATFPFKLSTSGSIRVLRELSFSPFESVGFDVVALAVVLLGAFLVYGATQLRRGPARGANFVAWSGAMIVWGLALIRSRGAAVNAETFRYTYLVLGFALLAIVPRTPIGWSALAPGAAARRRVLASAAIVLAFGAVRAIDVRGDLQDWARHQSENGRDALGTVLVVDLAPGAIPDDVPMTFYGHFNPNPARDVRRLLARPPRNRARRAAPANHRRSLRAGSSRTPGRRQWERRDLVGPPLPSRRPTIRHRMGPPRRRASGATDRPLLAVAALGRSVAAARRRRVLVPAALSHRPSQSIGARRGSAISCPPSQMAAVSAPYS
jgi:hypothetical protein